MEYVYIIIGAYIAGIFVFLYGMLTANDFYQDWKYVLYSIKVSIFWGYYIIADNV